MQKQIRTEIKETSVKAVLLYGYGDVSNLRYEDAPDPKPGAGEVLVRTIGTSVNPIDYKLREGALKERMPLKFPAILGRDVAGEVAETGEGVTQFRKGDLVMGLGNRSYAELVTVKAEDLARIPNGLDPQTAGVLPLVTLTGAQLVEQGVQPKSGEVVLVIGAAGSVGRAAVFCALEKGARVIAGVKSGQEEEVGGIGAESVVALDKDVFGLPELDAIADTVGRETLAKCLEKLKKGGRVATVVGKPQGMDQIDFREIWAHPDAARLHELAHAVRDGKLAIPIARRMRLSEIREAHEAAQKGAGGKILLLP
jgi:NADPH:quinone reductase-like Zn-dependent oxidoreductase